MADEFGGDGPERGVTRQGFVAGVTSGALVSATACASDPDEPAWDREVDVVVVGAGTGLVGALAAATSGADVLVLEKCVVPGEGTECRAVWPGCRTTTP